MSTSLSRPVLSCQTAAGLCRAIFVFGLVLIGARSFAAEQGPGENLIRNGNFEVGTADQTWAEGWNSPRLGSWSWEKDEAGGRYIRINTTEPNQALLLYQLVEIPADVKALELSLRARVIGLRCGTEPWFDARVMTDFKDSTGAKVKGAKTITFRKDTDGWVERKVTFNVPDTAVSIEIMPTLFKTYAGTFDLDEIVLRSIPEIPVAAPVAKP